MADGAIDMTKLANAKTEAEVDAAAAELNKKIREKGKPGGGAKKRLELLDEIRGICVLCMVCYHSLYVLGTQFEVDWGLSVHSFLRPLQPVFAAMFILIAGICSRLSRDAKKRGFMLTVIALLLSFLTILVLPSIGFENMQIWFGVLHLLAASTLLFALGKKLFDKIPALVGVLVCLVLFFVTAPVSQGYLGMFGFRVNLPDALYQTNMLFFLGFLKPGTEMLDYFPLLPYFFLFLFGSFMGLYAEREKFPPFCYNKHMLFFGFLGRHALPIYLLHVPVFYGIGYFLRAIASIGQ